jgi:hypothetical protein
VYRLVEVVERLLPRGMGRLVVAGGMLGRGTMDEDLGVGEVVALSLVPDEGLLQTGDGVRRMPELVVATPIVSQIPA